MSITALPSNISLRIVPRPAVRLIGIKIRTDRQTAVEDVGDLWRKALPRISEFTSGEDNASTYGISWVVDAGACSFEYCAAAEPGRDAVLPDEFEETIIPAGLYAECTLPSRDALHSLYDYLYHEWLPTQKESSGISDTPCYEVYSDNYLQEGDMKLYIPIGSE